jgi:hypothetical protein
MMVDLRTRKKYNVHSNGLKKNRNFAITNIMKIIVVATSQVAKDKKYDKTERKHQ